MSALEDIKGPDGLGGDAVAIGLRSVAPGFPVEAEELMEQAGAFKGKRDWGELGQGEHLSLDYPIIVANHRRWTGSVALYTGGT